MEALAALVLVCSLSTPGPDCTVATAVDVIRVPHVASVTTCMMHGQAVLASTALTPREGLEYAKVVCERTPRVNGISTPHV